MKHFKGFFEILLDFFEITIVGVTVFLLVYLFVGQLLEVTGDSMKPTFHNKEQIIAEKLSIKLKPLSTGEIVIFKHPDNVNRLLIKRVIALPGEKLKISNGVIFINGNPLNEFYLQEGTETIGNKFLQEDTEYLVPNHTYVLMGDNRKESSDSRVFGPVKEELIIGRALLVYYPLQDFRIVER